METHRLLLTEAGTPIVYMRTPLLPHEVAYRLYAGNWRANLKSLVVDNRDLRLAIRVASPALARELAKWLAGEEIAERALRRLLAYALRASTRTTPFGLFAAISRVAVGEQTTLEVESAMRTRTRMDMGWLGKLFAQWREDPEFRRKLRVTVNDAILRRGDRYTSYHPLHTGRTGKRGLTYTPMTFTATDAVRFLESEAQFPVAMQDLAALLREKFDEPQDECLRLLDDLWQAGFFVDELGIDPASPDPAREVLTRVEASESGRADGIAAVLDRLDALDERPVARRNSDDYDAIDAMQLAILPAVEGALQTDAVREASGALSVDVLNDVRLLARLMLHGPSMALREYRKQFIARYEGTTREVPLLELVHASFGLGSPASPDHDPLPSDLLERQILVASEALRDGSAEIILDEDSLATLMPHREDSRLAPSFDFGFEVLASSREALDRGEYLVTPGGFTYAARAGAALGRFADALGTQAHCDLQAIAAQLEALHPNAIVAELVASPSWSRGLNVSIRPVKHNHRVRVGLISDRTTEDIPLDDLVVGIDEVGFYLRSVRLRKRVVLTESHALNTANVAPTIPRFLALLAFDGIVFPREYEWDCRVSYLPRVRCGRVVLRRANWRFTRDVIEKATKDSFGDFARRWRMPRFVELVSGDNRLLLDTSSEICAQMLRDQLRPRQDMISLDEALCTPGNAWLRDSTGADFRAEFIASFVRTTVDKRRSPSAPIVPADARNHSPGSDWLYMKIYGDSHDQDRVLELRVAPVVQRLVAEGALERWYFLRYADPRAHLRVRMSIERGARSRVSGAVLDLLASLAQDGSADTSSVATYEREVERYGGPEGMAACEKVFAADSSHVFRHVVVSTMKDLDQRIAFAAQSIAEMALECAATERGFDPRSFVAERARLGDVDRENARQIKQRLQEARIVGPDLRGALRELAGLASAGRLSRPLESVFASLAHMHANRCALDEESERRARLLARQVLQGFEHLRVRRGDDGSVA